jgi:predicted nucleic acid-binding Zn ribbon protein
MSRAKYPHDEVLTGPLFRFLDATLTRENYSTLLLDLVNSHLPGRYQRNRVELDLFFAKRLQDELNAKLLLIFGPSHPDQLSSEDLARLAFDDVVHYMKTNRQRRHPLRAKIRSSCVVCGTWFAPDERQKITCSDRCRAKHHRDQLKARQKPARASRT